MCWHEVIRGVENFVTFHVVEKLDMLAREVF